MTIGEPVSGRARVSLKNRREQVPPAAPAHASALESLLIPTLALLHSSGVSEVEAGQLFRQAWIRAGRLRSRKVVTPINPKDSYAEIVARWSRDKRFLTADGTPRPLRFRGGRGIEGLVRSSSPGTSPRYALNVLIQFGTVQRVRNGWYQLVWPFFSVASSSQFAFEPSANFLADASATVLGMLKRSRGRPATGPFWRVADSTLLSHKHTPAFLAFLRKRSLPFLEEIDDWLQARATESTRGSSGVRLGLGLFSIASKQTVTMGALRQQSRPKRLR